MNHAIYLRKVNYYETDKMAIVHHSNYIRYMEEARLSFMEQSGLQYAALESSGIIIPVTAVSCQYRVSLQYGDEVRIETALTGFNGVRIRFHYALYRVSDGAQVCSGDTEHCFLDDATRVPVNLKKREPALCERWNALLALDAEGTKEEP